MIDTAIAAFDIVYPLCAVTSFLALGYKVRDLRRDSGNSALRALCLARLCTALAYVWITPCLYVRIDRLLGIANLGTLLSNGCIVFSALATQLMLLGWFNDPAGVRRKAPWVWAVFGTAVVAMILIFLGAPLPGEHPVDFEVYFAKDQYADAYMAVYLATYGLNLVNTARLTWLPSRAISHPWLRRSLRLTALGSVFITGYLLGKTLGVIGRWCGMSCFDAAAIVGAPVCANLGSLVLVVGGTFPGWGQRLMTRARQYRSLRRLYPLWFALCQATPGIALFPRRSPRPPVFVPALETRLYRLIIEIRDGQRALRPYVNAEQLGAVAREAQSAGMDGEELQVTLEAAAIRLGIREKSRGVQNAESVAGGTASSSTTDLASELSWLERVAHAFASSYVTNAADTGCGSKDAVAVRQLE
ncbi:MAB_1171c family putative transporter [Streptomyces sp. NPDC052396]|uniref:MAB_1171c family putative transporter n=1 Tax=Streptomyces sp. NPDC052396 TaxID=3365689 RepID=UPI0037D4DA7B